MKTETVPLSKETWSHVNKTWTFFQIKCRYDDDGDVSFLIVFSNTIEELLLAETHLL